MSAMRWDPQQYGRYADERGRPFLDLVERIGTPAPRRVVDLGCGPGNLTVLLHERWPGAAIEGIDSSPEMIEKAQALAVGSTETGTVTFTLGDIAAWQPPADADVIVSNAALQWVPGHQDLLRGWAATLPLGGTLAFQVPNNFGAPAHALMRVIARSPRWSGRLAGVLRHHDAVATTEEYAAMLLEGGLSVDAWETVYLHRLDGDDPVLDWVRGTGLRPVLAALPPDDAAAFEADYAAALREAYPRQSFGTLFPFRRTFVVATRRVRSPG